MFFVSLPLLSLAIGISRGGRWTGSETAVTCDVADVAVAGAIAAGGLDELGSDGFGRWRFLGDISRGGQLLVVVKSLVGSWEVNLPHVRFKNSSLGGDGGRCEKKGRH